jgi:hypothetical protein
MSTWIVAPNPSGATFIAPQTVGNSRLLLSPCFRHCLQLAAAGLPRAADLFLARHCGIYVAFGTVIATARFADATAPAGGPRAAAGLPFMTPANALRPFRSPAS